MKMRGPITFAFFFCCIVVNSQNLPIPQPGGFTYAWDDYDPSTFGNDSLVQDFTGVRTFSHVPAEGIHPRIYFGPDDLPEIIQRLSNTNAGQQAFKQIHAYTTVLRLGSSNYNRNASYAKDDYSQARVSNVGKWDSKDIYFKLINQDANALDGVDNKRRYLLASVMALEAFECLVMAGETDPDTGLSYSDRGNDLAKAMTHWANLVVNDPEISASNYFHFGGVHMAICYDLHFNSMTTTQQNTVRSALAKIISSEPLYGKETTYYATTSNWVGLNSFQLLTNFALEGETGYNPNLTKDYMRTYRNFLNHGWYDSGAGYEGLGKNYMMVTSMIAAAKRGYSLLGHPKLKAFGSKFLPAISQPYGYSFTGTDAWGGSGWDTKVGGYKFNASDAIGLKWVFPEDDGVDFMWENYVGSYYQNKPSSGYVYQSIVPAASGYLNYLVTAVMFADDYDSGDWETKAESALTSKSYLAPERGLVVMRSGYTKEDLMLHYHVRQDMGGHTYADRLNFALSGLGRIWVRYSFGGTYHESQYHSMVMINDKGVPLTPRDGVKARQPSKLLHYIESDDLVVASGDATYAYSYEWEWASKLPQFTHHDIYNGSEWSEVNEDWNDFRYQNGGDAHYEISFYDYAHWAQPGRLERIIKRPYNPMEKVYRTVGMIRGEKPFVIIADDVKKDNAVHNYKAYIQVADDLTVNHSDINLQADNYRNDLILKEPNGDRRLLIRVLNNAGQCANHLNTGNIAFSGKTTAKQSITSSAQITSGEEVIFEAGDSISLQSGFEVSNTVFSASIASSGCSTADAYLEMVDPDINGNDMANRVVIEANVVSPDFKYMLFPFRDGDALPVTQWNSDRTELTVIMSSSVKKISFSEVSGSTRMEMVE